MHFVGFNLNCFNSSDKRRIGLCQVLDVAETSRSLKHELAYQYSLISQIMVKTSIEVIRGRFHGEEGNRPDLKLEFYFFIFREGDRLAVEILRLI